MMVWRQLLDRYPGAKVILTVRESPAVWQRSWAKFLKVFEDTYKLSWYQDYGRHLSRTLALMKTNWSYCQAYLIGRPEFVAEHSPGLWINNYVMHNKAVQQIVPPDQLLIFK